MRPFHAAREAADPSALRILFLGSYDAGGGAAIAGERLIRRFERDRSAEVLQIVSRQREDSPRTISLHRAYRFLAWRRLRQATAVRNILAANPYGWLPFEADYILRAAKIWQPDVIHIHNLHGTLGTFPVSKLYLLSQTAPIVWTLHDMWALTGYCTYSMGCERWREGCGNCPDLTHYPGLLFDRTRSLSKAKSQAFRSSALTIVTPSRWLADLARQAPTTRGLDVQVIPNGVDLEVFHPKVREAGRMKLGIDDGSPVLMFAAETLDGDSRKGGRELRAAIKHAQDLRANAPLDVILMGGGGEALLTGIEGLRIHSAGFVSDESKAAELYAAADLFVCPSLEDNLPNTLIEAAACGTAAVVFDAGGSAEAVEPEVTGAVVGAGNAGALGGTISELLSDYSQLVAMGSNARSRAEFHYGDARLATDYLRLYRHSLRSWERPRKAVQE